MPQRRPQTSEAAAHDKQAYRFMIRERRPRRRVVRGVTRAAASEMAAAVLATHLPRAEVN